MLYGGVTYRLKAKPDEDVYIPWAGRVVFTPFKEGEPVKIRFYQVYLVCAPGFPGTWNELSTKAEWLCMTDKWTGFFCTNRKEVNRGVGRR